MLKDQSSNKIIFEGDFHESVKDKMQKVVVINVPFKEQDECDKTTGYTKCFSSSNKSETDMIRWMFENTQENLSDYDIDIMPLLENAKDYTTALEILNQHASWIDLDGKFNTA